VVALAGGLVGVRRGGAAGGRGKKGPIIKGIKSRGSREGITSGRRSCEKSSACAYRWAPWQSKGSAIVGHVPRGSS
jgi:hypothetical protein